MSDNEVIKDCWNCWHSKNGNNPCPCDNNYDVSINWKPKTNQSPDVSKVNAYSLLADVRALQEEAKIISEIHPSKDARFFAKNVYKFLCEHYLS
jgi:hypothetical protein